MPPDLNNQNQFTDQKEVNFKKPPVYIVALIIFAALLGAFQIADMYLGKGNQPQPEQNLTATDPTKDWKTYTNEEYGFELKYPDTWYFSEENNEVWFSTKDALERPSIMIKINQGSIEEISKNIKEGVDDFIQPNIVEGQLDFNGIKANYIDHGTAIGDLSRHIIFINNGSTFWIRYGHDWQPDEQILSTFKFISTSATSSNINFVPISNEILKYELRDFNVPLGHPDHNNSRLVQINKDKTEITLINSVLDAVPELREKGYALNLLSSVPTMNQKIFFDSYKPDSDAPPFKVYGLDIKTLRFYELPIATKWYKGFGSKYVSPGGNYIATVTNHDDYKDEQKIFLLDLEKDSVRIVAAVSGKETINKCSKGSDCWGVSNDMVWIDNNTLKYSVYDSTQPDGLFYYTLIESRVVKID